MIRIQITGKGTNIHSHFFTIATAHTGRVSVVIKVKKPCGFKTTLDNGATMTLLLVLRDLSSPLSTEK